MTRNSNPDMSVGLADLAELERTALTPQAGDPEDLAKRVRGFLEFVEPFRAIPAKKRMVDLKREHTLRVLDNAKRIARGAELAPNVRGLAVYAALYHDIGRFPQYEKYGTFSDARSENHALLGVKTLKRLGLLRDLPRADQRMILAAVAMHNRVAVPKAVAPDLGQVTAVVRDADKLDVMRLMLDHFSGGFGDEPVVVLHVKEHPTAYTPAVLERVLAGRMGRYADLNYVNDFKILLCGWIYDLNYPASYELVRDRRLLARLLDTLPDLPMREELGNKVLGELAARLIPAC